MKKNRLYLLLPLILITLLLSSAGCESGPGRVEREKNTEKGSSRDKEGRGNEVEKEEILVVRSEFSYNPENNRLSDNNLYDILYDCAIYVRNIEKQTQVECSIFDSQDNRIFTSSDLQFVKESKGLYKIVFSFEDIFLHNSLRYELNLSGPEYKEDESIRLSGEIKNLLVPYCENIGFGPIVTEELPAAIRTSLFIDFNIITPDSSLFDKVEWIRLIPPSQDFFWNIPYEHIAEENLLQCSGSVYDSGKGNFIENGLYILQINLGRSGIIQKELSLTDFFSNSEGPNYGLSVASPTAIDRHNVKLDISLKSKIEFIELEIYEKRGNDYQKLGRARFDKAPELLAKQDIYEAVVDEYNNSIELEKNKDYYFKIYLHSSAYHKVRYISISKMYKIKFQQFGIFPFY